MVLVQPVLFTPILSQQLDVIFDETHWPMMPCLFAHLCLPFSPVCARSYCAGQRTERVKLAVQKANVKLVEQGYYW